MIIASSNMQTSSKRHYSKSVGVSTSTSMTQMGSFAATAGFAGSSRQSLTKSGSQSMSFQSSVRTALGQSKDYALPSENYTNTKQTSAKKGVSGRESGARYSIRRYLLRYVEMIWEMMSQRVSGHRSSTISMMSGSNSLSAFSLDLTMGTGDFTTWYREDTTSYTYEESESTSFSAQGTVVTADGREISIDVKLNMSRSYTETMTSYTNSIQTILTDPLIIQLDDCPISVSDEKFEFDIDSDGVKDHISKLSKGSAFLALDRNGDGKINNGSELFGTKSGNGFRDLAAYDEDGNGWIDENDSIFHQLKLWQKDDAGNDKLTSLKEQGIGALYLGSQSTRFTLNSIEDNTTNGVVKSTGLYLKENGQTKTMAQVDLAVS